MDAGESIPILQKNQLFQYASKEDLEAIAQLFEVKNFQPYDFIIHQGDIGNEVFIIVSGKVEVLQWKQDTRAYTQPAVLGEHDNFGEMSLLDDDYRSASVRALQPTCVLAFSRKQFNLILSKPVSHLIYKNIAVQLSRRLKLANELFFGSADTTKRIWTLRRLLALIIFSACSGGIIMLSINALLNN